MDAKKLDYFKRKLVEKQLALEQMVQRSDSYGREKEPNIQDIADMAAESYTREFNFGRSAGDRRILAQIGDALDRISNRSFGICVHCEDEIQPKRLEAVPWAEYCIRCQSLQEKGMLDN